MPELVGADHEDRVVEALGPEQLDRTRVAVEANVVGREGGARQREPILGGRVDLAMAGRSLTRTTSCSTPKCSLAASATATWPRCGGSNAPP